MPIVYSPGEGETRPLNPAAIVYTSAQKVAELLGIGPGEAVLASADTEADRVYVTGADYRGHGFAVDDTVLIYSDAQALGAERTITSISEGGANGVALYFTGTNISNPNDFQVADNTYIQNQASFTNGKTRGMKRSTVETRILETQDRIDNVTHNAWRPYLVNAEYINFDTYKPYRRRYYTDYVGTVPLLFRNVQQILKLEVWQGDKYRELAGTGATLKINELSTNSMGNPLFYFGLPNGAFATITSHSNDYTNWAMVTESGTGYSSASGLSAGGGSGTGMIVTATTNNGGAVTSVSIATPGSGYVSGDTLTIPGGDGSAKFRVKVANTDTNMQWSGQFGDIVHTHQDFADTINQEDRANKTKINFTPHFTLPGSSTNVTVKDEFMAVANADYGTGVLKLTSMRQTKGGNKHTVAFNSTTQAQISDVDIVTTYGRYSGPLSSATLTTGGTGYSAGNEASTASTGLGTCTLTVTVTAGAVTGIALHTAGNNHKIGDVLTFGSGGFTATVSNIHPTGDLWFTDINGVDTGITPAGLVPGVMKIGDAQVISVSGIAADYIQMSNMIPLYDDPPSPLLAPHIITQYKLKNDIGQYSDAGGDQARLKDWWLDAEMGIIYFNNSYPFFEWNAVKASYIYGERYLEQAIQEAATKLVAADLLMSDDRSVLVPEGSQNVDLGAKIQLYRKEAEEILKRYKEMVVFA